MQIEFGAKSYLARNVYLDMLEDSSVRLIGHLVDSDLQVLGFRCFTMDFSTDWRSNKML